MVYTEGYMNFKKATVFFLVLMLLSSIAVTYYKTIIHKDFEVITPVTTEENYDTE